MQVHDGTLQVLLEASKIQVCVPETHVSLRPQCAGLAFEGVAASKNKHVVLTYRTYCVDADTFHWLQRW